MPITSQTSLDNLPVEFGYSVVGEHTTIATATLATAQTVTKPDTATALLAQNTGTSTLRWKLDGTDPTTTAGFQLPTGQMAVIIPCPGAAIKFIRESAGGALDYQWVR